MKRLSKLLSLAVSTTCILSSVSFAASAVNYTVQKNNRWYYSDETSFRYSDFGANANGYLSDGSKIDFAGNSPESMYVSGKTDYNVSYRKGSSTASLSVKIGLCGDANMDGKIDVRDASYIGRCAAGTAAYPTDFNTFLADSDRDGTVTIRDASFLSKYLAEQSGSSVSKDKEEKKAKAGKKRVKVAGPETADAAHDWTPLPCEALLEHLLPGSPELEATRRHGQHVAHLAEQLFDQLQPLHGLDGRWLYRLRIACCLHDIGFASGRKGHHKKGMRIVEQDTSLALLPEDRSLVAQLVRYHRKAWPAMRHRRFAALGKKDREALNKAAALIRMADALDYRHMEAVRDVAIDLQPGKVVLTLSGAQDCAPEQDRLLVKGDLFMHIFGVELECVCPIL